MFRATLAEFHRMEQVLHTQPRDAGCEGLAPSSELFQLEGFRSLFPFSGVWPNWPVSTDDLQSVLFVNSVPRSNRSWPKGR